MPISDQQLRARNNTRHGILASVLLIAGESRERFNALVNGLHAEYEPVTPTELSLIDKIAAAQWRQQRAWAMESACLTQEIESQPAAQASTDPAVRAMRAHRSISGASHHLDLLSRYEHRYDRQQYRAIEALTRLRSKKNAKMPFDPNLPEQNQQIPKNDDPIRIPSESQI